MTEEYTRVDLNKDFQPVQPGEAVAWVKLTLPNGDSHFLAPEDLGKHETSDRFTWGPGDIVVEPAESGAAEVVRQHAPPETHDTGGRLRQVVDEAMAAPAVEAPVTDETPAAATDQDEQLALFVQYLLGHYER